MKMAGAAKLLLNLTVFLECLYPTDTDRSTLLMSQKFHFWLKKCELKAIFTKHKHVRLGQFDILKVTISMMLRANETQESLV